MAIDLSTLTDEELLRLAGGALKPPTDLSTFSDEELHGFLKKPEVAEYV